MNSIRIPQQLHQFDSIQHIDLVSKITYNIRNFIQIKNFETIQVVLITY